MKGPLLNDWVEVGETRYTDLFGTLIRFRLHNIAVVADIVKAFLIIEIQEDDRDALKSLWKKDPFDTSSKFQVLRFIRVCCRLVNSIFYFWATINHLLNRCLEDRPDINPDIINKIKYSLYVDDLSSGAEIERCVRALHSFFVDFRKSKYESSKIEKQDYDVH